MKLSVLICLGLFGCVASYTPRMFRPGGKYYSPPPGSGGIDPKTRAELSGILNGILSNLQHHKAALPQVAQDIVTQFHLSDKDAPGIQDMYENLDADDSNEKDAKVVLASVLQKVDSSYTPRMFAPGGKYYNPPHFGRSNGISKATRDEVGNILKGILGNLMKHKAALSQAKEVVQQYHLDDKANAEVYDGLMDVYEELQTPTSGDGLKNLLKDEKALSSEADRSQASAVLALVIQQANASYVPGSIRPRRFSGYIPSRTRGLGISKGTRDQVAGILKGILENLTKHKAALGQLADDVTKQYQGNTQVAEGLQGAYADLANQKELAGASKEVQGQVKTVLASVLAKVVKH
jgi:uncharacterized protein YejL (UPF0352 family)